jgi:uncharacterized protein YjhX (UPF0386 family)
LIVGWRLAAEAFLLTVFEVAVGGTVLAQLTKEEIVTLHVLKQKGFLNIDNNASERALKRVAIGRKNWLFAGTDEAAANHAKLWSLIASCERHNLDPQRYLTSVLAKLPFIREADPQELEQFLPNVWKKDDAADPPPAPR